MNNNDLTLRSVKILNYSYVVLLQFFPAILCSYLFDKIFDNQTEEEHNKKSIYQIFFELWLHFWSILVLYYIFRNIIEQIPSPFDGLFNTKFKNSQLKEVKNGVVFTTVFILFQTSLRTKIKIFKDKLL